MVSNPPSNCCFPTNGFSLIAVGRRDYVLHQPSFVSGFEKFAYQTLYTLAQGRIDLFENDTVQYIAQNLYGGERLCRELMAANPLRSLTFVEFLLSTLDSVRYYQKVSSISFDRWPVFDRRPLRIPLLVNSSLDYIRRGRYTSYLTTVFFFNKEMQRAKQQKRIRWHSYTMKRGTLLFCIDVVNILRRNTAHPLSAKALNVYQDRFLKDLTYLVDIANPKVKYLSKRHKIALLELYDTGIDLIKYYRNKNDKIASYIALNYRL